MNKQEIDDFNKQLQNNNLYSLDLAKEDFLVRLREIVQKTNYDRQDDGVSNRNLYEFTEEVKDTLTRIIGVYANGVHSTKFYHVAKLKKQQLMKEMAINKDNEQ